MLNRILAVTALGLAVGLAACDQGGQEQAQTPKNQERQQSTTPQRETTTPSAPPSQAPSSQAPSSQPPASQPPAPSGGGSTQ